MAKDQMPHPGHDKHLCYLVNLGFQIGNPDEYRAIVRDGKFFSLAATRPQPLQKNLPSLTIALYSSGLPSWKPRFTK